MRIEQVESVVERGGQFLERAFTIKADAKMFSLLSDKIYADKPGAVVREIASNAKDAHTAAGKPNVPFDIHVPNIMYPHFTVRDYGNGLTHVQMFEIYTAYSESTKTESNKEIGAFGVGAKSPFAYTDSFTINSYTGGVKRTYTAFIGEAGIPVLALMNEIESDEPSGLEVTIPIKIDDYGTFTSKVFSVLQYFDPLPNIKGLAKEQIKFLDHPHKFEGTGWGIRRRSNHYNASNEPRIIQGGVFYPVNFSSVYGGNIPAAIYPLTSQPIDIFYDMVDSSNERGALDVALSREALSYDEYTCDQIKKCVDVIHAEVYSKIETFISSQKTWWEACVEYDNLRDTIGSILPDKMMWNGKPVSNHMKISLTSEQRNLFTFTYFNNSRHYRRGYVNRDEIQVIAPNAIQIYWNDLVKGASGRMRQELATRRGQYLMITPSSQSTLRDRALLEDTLGNPPIVNASTLNKVQTKSYSKSVVEDGHTDIHKWVNVYNRNGIKRLNWERTTVKVSTGGYYVKVKNSAIMVDNVTAVNNNSTIISLLRELKIVPTGEPIYGVTRLNEKRLVGKPGWIDLIELARSQCNAVMNDIAQLNKEQGIARDLYNVTGGARDLFNMFTHGDRNNMSKHLHLFTNPDMVSMFDLMKQYTTAHTVTNISGWDSLSNLLNIEHHNSADVKERENVVARISKLWDNVVSINQIIKFIHFPLHPDSTFLSSLADLTNKGVQP
jgi:hypothetical protein